MKRDPRMAHLVKTLQSGMQRFTEGSVELTAPLLKPSKSSAPGYDYARERFLTWGGSDDDDGMQDTLMMAQFEEEYKDDNEKIVKFFEQQDILSEKCMRHCQRLNRNQGIIADAMDKGSRLSTDTTM
ncbi:UNVERIFIED_CONTAM: hypothetical protein FKN15_031963 [Acipenser sinensis]